MDERELIYLFRTMPTEVVRNENVIKVAKLLFPSNSCCSKCGLPWSACESRSVNVNKTRGVFATCDVCWDSSSLNELYGYYEAVYKMQTESASKSGGRLSFTLEHLLKCVCKEFYASTNS